MIKGLDQKTRVDFALLDSANDPQLILNEFRSLVPFLTKDQAVVAIDDVAPPGRKGDYLVPYLKAAGFIEHRRHATGRRLLLRA